MVGEIISSVERLGDLPESGRIVPEFGVSHLREIIMPPFRIIYRLDKTQLRVVRVWRSEVAQDALGERGWNGNPEGEGSKGFNVEHRT